MIESIVGNKYVWALLFIIGAAWFVDHQQSVIRTLEADLVTAQITNGTLVRGNNSMRAELDIQNAAVLAYKAEGEALKLKVAALDTQVLTLRADSAKRVDRWMKADAGKTGDSAIAWLLTNSKELGTW